MSDLPGILPPDAGRLERAARRYAIAQLSSHMLRPLTAIRLAREVLLGSPFLADAEPAMSVPVWEARLLRARVALYLRWAERVERWREREHVSEWGFWWFLGREWIGDQHASVLPTRGWAPFCAPSVALGRAPLDAGPGTRPGGDGCGAKGAISEIESEKRYTWMRKHERQ